MIDEWCMESGTVGEDAALLETTDAVKAAADAMGNASKYTGYVLKALRDAERLSGIGLDAVDSSQYALAKAEKGYRGVESHAKKVS